MEPQVEAFFDEDTFTFSYVLVDPESNAAAVVDPVLDYDPAAGRTSTVSVDRIVDYVGRNGLELQWILETHVHADHLSAARYLKQRLGGRIGIGNRVAAVQKVFGDLFNAEPEFCRDGSQFDHLFEDGERAALGGLSFEVMHTPGHTPACISYVFDGAVFVGDTLFMPDYGTARSDFPGGDAATLYRSIQRILALPDQTAVYLCHDYLSGGRREYQHRTTVAEERNNIHLKDNVTEADFVRFREQRDAELAAPRLLLPSVQFNMRGAELPPAESNGTHYFKIPVRPA